MTRVLVLFFWEVFLEWTAALRAIRRDVRPRGHRGGIYPFMRAAMCVVVRDLIVYGVLSDMLQGQARDLRDLLQLRRGRPPLRPRACRHARGAAEARSAVRPHRPRTPVLAAPVRDRRPLGSRPDAGCDVQAAERLRARRPRRALADVGRGRGLLRRRRAERDGRARGERGDRRGHRRRSGRRTTCPTARSSSWDRGTSASSTSWTSGAA